ncbi:MAG: apolipoprotein N-acyltransferase [Plectolyngbya sp. WJT66-NPBG17]|jgi:apolipoprotein N-acyltransferase|nr:apolipoprotein N-acyltransferase [Plectolyngbya sp. WJT66-NPBG17]
MKWNTSLTIAILSAFLMGLATAPISIWWLAWVALAPLWVMTVKTRSMKPAIVWGIVYHGFALHWITGLHPLMWLGMSWITSVSIVAFAWAFITLWGSVCTGVWAWVLARVPGNAIARVITGTALWCGLEWMRQWSALDWTTLAYTQSPHNLIVLHLGRISGVLTVTAAIVAVNGLIAEAWLARSKRLIGSAITLFVILHLIGFGLFQSSIVQSSEAKLTAGIVQGNIPTREKLFSEGLKQALNRYSSGYRSLADQGADFVVTPEGALPFLWQGENLRNAVNQAIVEKRVLALLGTFVPEGTRYTQSLIAVAPDGSTIARYNKIKLVPLGEYLPFEKLLGGLIGRLSPIQSFLVPGDFKQQFEAPFGRIAIGICFDSAFSEVFRKQVANDAQFLITASNLDPYSTVLMAQHEAHDVIRAIETDRWAVRVTNTGYSGIVDPHGRVKWRSQNNQYVIHADTIYRQQTQTLYVKWGNWLTPILLGMSAVLFFISRNQR